MFIVGSSGLDRLVGILKFNAGATADEFETETCSRERIPQEMWRALPDSPDSLVWVRTYTGPDTPPEMRQWRLGDLPQP